MNEIAILLPVHNAEKFLPDCLDSIRTQSFEKFVLFAADDGSRDRSWEILERAAAEDPRFRIFRNERNLGVAGTLNFLLRQAEGSPLTARMDADDLAEPSRLQRQYDFLAAHPEIHIAGSALAVIDEDGTPLGIRRYPTHPDAVRRKILLGNPLAHPAVMARTEVLKTLGGYRNIAGAEDYDLWLRAAAEGFRMANLPEPLLHYRISAGQVKQRHLKRTLRSTLKLQRRYLFRREFFSLSALLHYGAGNTLRCLPDAWIMKLFMRRTLDKSGDISR